MGLRGRVVLWVSEEGVVRAPGTAPCPCPHTLGRKGGEGRAVQGVALGKALTIQGGRLFVPVWNLQ